MLLSPEDTRPSRAWAFFADAHAPLLLFAAIGGCNGNRAVHLDEGSEESSRRLGEGLGELIDVLVFVGLAIMIGRARPLARQLLQVHHRGMFSALPGRVLGPARRLQSRRAGCNEHSTRPLSPHGTPQLHIPVLQVRLCSVHSGRAQYKGGRAFLRGIVVLIPQVSDTVVRNVLAARSS